MPAASKNRMKLSVHKNSFEYNRKIDCVISDEKIINK